jgi:hypothetical protein
VSTVGPAVVGSAVTGPVVGAPVVVRPQRLYEVSFHTRDHRHHSETVSATSPENAKVKVHERFPGATINSVQLK